MKNYITPLLTLSDNPITDIKLKKQVNYDIEHLPEDSLLHWDKVREVYNTHWLNQEQEVWYQIQLGKYEITVEKINNIVSNVHIYESN